MQRETLLHLDRTPDGDDALGKALGAAVNTHFHSGKPRLVFVAFDDTATTTADLVARARRAGYRAQVVDL